MGTKVRIQRIALKPACKAPLRTSIHRNTGYKKVMICLFQRTCKYICLLLMEWNNRAFFRSEVYRYLLLMDR